MTTPTTQDVPDEKHSTHTADTLHNSSDHMPHLEPIKSHRLHTENLLPPPEEARALSPAGTTREQASRLNDDLELLRAERLVSSQEAAQLNKTKSRNRGRSEPIEEDIFIGEVKEEVPAKAPPEKHAGAFAYKTWLYMRKFPRILRYFVYMLPGGAILLIPVMLGRYAVSQDSVAVGGSNGVNLMWFGIWLEVLWGTLWVSRMVTSLMPLVFGGLAIVLGSSNHKKWKDIGFQLEFHTALFLWMLTTLCTFKPIVNAHRIGDVTAEVRWVDVVNKIVIALFVGMTLNFVEKICIQWIAASFHSRTYAQRIENNKSNINIFVHLYEFSKMRIDREDSIWDPMGERTVASGARTPMAALHNNVRHVWNKAGVVANKVGNDLVGRKKRFSHDRKIVYEMLRTTASAHALARLMFRSLVRPDRETIYLEDMQVPFKDEESSELAFGIFDKDLNGDISMEEMEGVVNEAHLERKAIAASLKDLDSVVEKLDKVFLFLIVVITVIVFVSIISDSAAASLASATTFFLGLTWMLQATAQEFLQSIIFVFIKHPFDVGDRVTVYGNTGSMMKGDDYYVTEISLLYTEFKKMEGHIVQAPNSLLNTLFILSTLR